MRYPGWQKYKIACGSRVTFISYLHGYITTSYQYNFFLPVCMRKMTNGPFLQGGGVHVKFFKQGGGSVKELAPFAPVCFICFWLIPVLQNGTARMFSSFGIHLVMRSIFYNIVHGF